MDRIAARFTPAYNLAVFAASGGLFALMVWLIVLRGDGWSLSGDGLTVTENAVKLVVLGLLMLSLFGTQAWDMLRPRDIVLLTPQGVHDRRLTRGQMRWDQIRRIHLYRKGWQWMANIELKTLTTEAVDLGLGPMPLYAFNRLCARWLKRPELNIGLGGMTVSSQALIDYILAHYKGSLTREQ